MLGGVRIRLLRWGFRNKAMYTMSVMHRRRARNSGNRLEDVGWWDPNPAGDGNMHIGLKFDRIKYWLTAGAEPSTKVTQLLGRVGMLPEPPQPPGYQGPKPNTKWQAKSKE